MSGADKFVTVNGLSLHYVEHGDRARPTMVCLHGGGGHGHAWDAFASLVSDHFHVVALTFRGHGDSDRAHWYSYDLLNLDTAQFIRTLGLGPAVVIGHSLGGGTALCVAALWPDLVSHLVIVDASIRPNPLAWKRIVESMRERPENFPSVEKAVAYFRGNLPGMPEDELRRYIEVDLVLGDDGRYRRKYDMNMARAETATSQDEADRLQREMDEENRRLLTMIRCPTLLVRGARSDILLPEVRDDMLSLLANAHYVEIDTNHWVFQERPREFADAVLGFLAATR